MISCYPARTPSSPWNQHHLTRNSNLKQHYNPTSYSRMTFLPCKSQHPQSLRQTHNSVFHALRRQRNVAGQQSTKECNLPSRVLPCIHAFCGTGHSRIHLCFAMSVRIFSFHVGNPVGVFVAFMVLNSLSVYPLGLHTLSVAAVNVS